MKSLLCMGVCLSLGLSASAKTIYVAEDGNDTTGDGSFESPYLTPSNGIAHAETDDVVFLKNGTYEICRVLNLDKRITLRGEDREDTIIRNVGKTPVSYTATNRVVNLTAAGARVETMTIREGVVNAASGNESYGGANIRMTADGVISNCIVSTGRGIWMSGTLGLSCGGGLNIYAKAGTITHCIVTDGVASGKINGGGICIAGNNVTVETCLVYGNRACAAGKTQGWGGGICVANVTGVKILNSTIVGNEAQYGGGIYCANKNTVVKNCIVAGNVSASTDASAGAPNWYYDSNGGTTTADDWAKAVSNCLWGMDRSCGAIGAGSFVADPGFTDAANADYTLGVGSPAIGKGVPYEGIPVDLNGTPRKDPPDIGCYQSDHAKPMSCSIAFTPQKAFVGSEIAFAGTVEDGREGATYDFYWSLVDGGGARLELDSREPSVSRTFDTLAEYEVFLSVTNRADADDFAFAKASNKLVIAPFTNYVTCAAEAVPVYPYATPETAAKTLAAALKAVIPGSVVVIDAGTNLVSGAITLTDKITIRGAGRDATVLRASGTGYRLFLLDNADAILRDLTLSGAYCGDNGAAVNIASSGGQVLNCALVGNTLDAANRNGGAICALSSAAVVDNCIVSCNTNISHEYAWAHTRNTINMSGGRIRNTLISRNYLRDLDHSDSGRIVGLSGSAVMENCTLVDNEDRGKSGCAVYLEGSAKIINTVFSGNTTPNRTISGYLPNLVRSGSSTVQTSLFVGSQAYGATSRTAEDAGFVDAANGDYHLKPTSKACRNWGTLLDWMDGATDLDGNPRVVGKAPDIGCYECPFGPGLMLLVR